MSELRRIFITVKTYPTLSRKYDELVCTAGILDDGSWARLHPLPFRKLEHEQKYRKYQWIQAPLEKNTADRRPETYRITDLARVEVIGEPVGTGRDGCWRERKSIVFA